jgi:hypothetical protein
VTVTLVFFTGSCALPHPQSATRAAPKRQSVGQPAYRKTPHPRSTTGAAPLGCAGTRHIPRRGPVHTL